VHLTLTIVKVLVMKDAWIESVVYIALTCDWVRVWSIHMGAWVTHVMRDPILI
jgi:hypothetical protein